MLHTDTYIELLKAFPPRTIKTEEDWEATQNVVDSLIDKGKLTQDERDYLNLLGTLISFVILDVGKFIH